MLRKYLLALDLTIVSIWMIFGIWILGYRYPACCIVLPFALLRLGMSFTLYRREKKCGWLLLLAAVPLVLALSETPDGVCCFFLMPFAKFWDCCVAFFTGFGDMQHGMYRHLKNSYDVEAPATWQFIVPSLMALWVVLEPFVTFSVLAIRRKLVSIPWNWKALGILTVTYVALSCLVALFPGNPPFPRWYEDMTVVERILQMFNRKELCTLFLLLWVGLAGYLLKPSRAVWKYFALFAIVGFSALVGLLTDHTFSMIALFVLPIFYSGLFFFDKENKWSKIYVTCLVAWNGTAPMWMKSCVIGGGVDFLVWVGLIVILTACYFYGRRQHSWQKGVLAFLFCGLLIPILCLGYNPFVSYGGMRGNGGDTHYLYSQRGAAFIYGKDDKIGLCDRYGVILPAEYERMSLLTPTLPYMALQKDSLCGIYDIEKHEMIVEPKYKSIKEFHQTRPHRSVSAVYEMTYTWGEHEFKDYFKIRSFYYGHGPNCYYVDNTPFVHSLDEDMPLRYCDEIDPKGHLDRLLATMMRALWQNDEDVSYADSYWDWATNLTAEIDSLYEKKGLFHSADTTRYDMAMDALCDFVSYSEAGSQAEMNCGSYVEASTEIYRTIKANLDFAAMFPKADIRREWTLFNIYMKAKEDFYAENDDRHYSSKPMEDNYASQLTFQERTRSLKAVMAAAKGKAIPRTGKAVTDDALRHYFHESMPGFLRPAKAKLTDPDPIFPTDTIGQYFFQWIAYRDTLASQLPPKVRLSYRNQTANIRYETIYKQSEPRSE